MARRLHLYIPKADEAKVRRLEATLKRDRMSISEWFIRCAIARLKRQDVQNAEAGRD